MGLSAPYTNHAFIRAQQRSLPPVVVEWLMNFGEEQHLGSGLTRYTFSRRSWRRLEAHLGRVGLTEQDKVKSAYVIVADDSSVVTIGHRTGRLRTH